MNSRLPVFETCPILSISRANVPADGPMTNLVDGETMTAGSMKRHRKIPPLPINAFV